jgi:hypothetical protein
MSAYSAWSAQIWQGLKPEHASLLPLQRRSLWRAQALCCHEGSQRKADMAVRVVTRNAPRGLQMASSLVVA